MTPESQITGSLLISILIRGANYLAEWKFALNIFDDNEKELSEDELKLLVDTFQKVTEESVNAVNILDAENDIISLEEEIVRKQLTELATKRRELEAKKREERAKARAAENKLVQAQRRYNTFMSEKAIREKMAQEIDQIDRLTSTAGWREFAYNHQIEGAKRLAVAKRGICGDKRGLGKSLTSIIWLDMVNAKRIVIVAPRDVLRNFQRELEHWAPHRNSVVMQGLTKNVRDMFLSTLKAVDEFILLINYEAWRRDETIIEKLIELKIDTIVCDEAHKMKEGKTSAYRGVNKLVYAENACNVCGGDVESYRNPITDKRITRCSICFEEAKEFNQFCSVKNVLPMTGTAIMNKPQDLFTLLHLIDRVNFDKLSNFLSDYCRQDYQGNWTFAAGGEDRLMARLGANMVSRTPKTAGIKMPEQIRVPHIIEFENNLYPKQRKAMEQIRNYCLSMMTGEYEMRMDVAIAMITRLRQAVTWPGGIKVLDPITKEVAFQCDVHESIIMDEAEEIALQAIDEGDRVVMFSQFKEVLKEMERRLYDAGIRVCRYDGDTTERQRQNIQYDFDSKNQVDGKLETPWDPITNPDGYKYQVVLAHYTTGGTGLNLDLARQTVLIDRAWNPATEDQAMGRTNRINTKHGSVVHTIHVNNTITTWLDSIIQNKQDILNGYEGSVNLVEEFLSGMRDGSIM